MITKIQNNVSNLSRYIKARHALFVNTV